MDNQQTWTNLANLVFSAKPKKAEAIFCHAWGDLHKEMIQLAANLFKKIKPGVLVLNGLAEYERGKPGFSHWQRELVNKYHLPKKKIVATKPARFTLEEAKEFAAYAKAHKITKALVVSVPQHIVRAFLTDLGMAKRQKLAIRLRPYTLPKINWYEKIIINSIMNSPEKTSRLGRLFGEFCRMNNYYELMSKANKGFIIARPAEGVEHLERKKL